MNIQHPNSNIEQLLFGATRACTVEGRPRSRPIIIIATRLALLFQDGTEPVPPCNQEFHFQGLRLCRLKYASCCSGGL